MNLQLELCCGSDIADKFGKVWLGIGCNAEMAGLTSGQGVNYLI